MDITRITIDNRAHNREAKGLILLNTLQSLLTKKGINIG